MHDVMTGDCTQRIVCRQADHEDVTEDGREAPVEAAHPVRICLAGLVVGRDDLQCIEPVLEADHDDGAARGRQVGT